MKKQLKLMVLSLATLATSAALIGCGRGTGGDDEKPFTIMYYPGGYGDQWLRDFAKETLAIEKGCTPEEIVEGKDFKLVADAEPSTDTNLKSKTKCPDLIFSNGFSASQISSGLIEQIQDVYDAEVETSKGKMAIKDYLIDDCAQQFCFQKRYGQGQRLAYGLPMTNIPISIAYNETILLKTPHDASNPYESKMLEGTIDATTKKWTRAPQTVDELKAYWYDLDQSNPSLVKFGWSLADGSNWFEPLYATWWAEAQGLDQPHMYKSEGSYYDFWEYGSAEIYKQTGIQKAFETVQSLIVKNGEFVNSHPNYKTFNIKDMQSAFARGEMAMCLTGDFFEHEYADILKNNTDSFKLMRIPSIEGAETNSDGSVKKLTFVNTSSVLFVPSGAKHKELAKKFLIYSSQEAQVIRFLKETGGIRPFQFDPYELCPDYEFTTFQASTLDLYFHADDLLMKYPRNAADKNNISPIYIYEGVNARLFSVTDYASLLYAIKDYTPKQVCIETVYDGKVKKFESLYDRAKTAFDNWRYIYGL